MREMQIVRTATRRLGDINGGRVDMEFWSDGTVTVSTWVNGHHAALAIVSARELEAAVVPPIKEAS